VWRIWRVALSLATVGTSPGVRLGQDIYSQNRDGYDVQGCGRGGGGVKCGCMQGYCEGVRSGVRSWPAIQASGDGTVTCELVVSDQLSCGATEEGMQVETPNKVVEFTLIRIQQTYYY